MINRENWHDVKQYLKYKERVEQSSPKTLKRIRGSLRHVLEWADSQPLGRARAIDPTFPIYLLTARVDGKVGRLAPASMDKNCEQARGFFRWARQQLPAKYKNITDAWIGTIQPGRSYGLQSQLFDREIFTLEEVRKVLAYQPEHELLKAKRDRAALALLFLSGMRAGAFVTLTIDCIQLDTRTVMQDPGRGVETKNNKAARTYLLDIPDLIQVVKEWDDYVRARLPLPAPWYCKIRRDGESVEQDFPINSESRRIILDRGIRALCNRAGVDFKSAHKLRHGHAVWSLKKAKNIGELKAISQNLMHSNISTTEGIYGKLVEDDVRNVVTHLRDDGMTQPDDGPGPAKVSTAEKLRVLRSFADDPEAIRVLLELLGQG